MTVYGVQHRVEFAPSDAGRHVRGRDEDVGETDLYELREGREGPQIVPLETGSEGGIEGFPGGRAMSGPNAGGSQLTMRA